MTKAQSIFTGFTTGWVIGTRIGFLIAFVGILGAIQDFWVKPLFSNPYDCFLFMLACAIGTSTLGAVSGFFVDPNNSEKGET